MKSFFITGTDTGVGKTEVAVYLARYFASKGLRVGMMKPIVTGSSEDARILCINAVSFRLPLAPLVASRLEGIRVNKGKIWEALERLKANSDIVIVEGIGGVMVPISGKDRKVFYVSDMISKMNLPAIIVARPNLGTINHTLMTIEMLRSKRVKIAGIIFNHASRIKKDISIKTNPEIIEELSGIKVLGIMVYNRSRNKRRIKWLRKIEF